MPTPRTTLQRLATLSAVLCLGALTLTGCGLGLPGGGASATPTPAPTATQIVYHLDSSVSRNCSWQTGGPATCQVYVTNKADSNFTFTWQGVSDPVGASFAPDSGSLAPGETSGLIVVTADSTICPITFRFVDTLHQLESDSQFNPCNG